MEGPRSESVPRLCVCSLQKAELHLEARFCFSYSKIICDTRYICLGFALYLHSPLSTWLLHQANEDVSRQCAVTVVHDRPDVAVCIHRRKARQSLRWGSSISQGRVKGKPFSADLYKACCPWDQGVWYWLKPHSLLIHPAIMRLSTSHKLHLNCGCPFLSFFFPLLWFETMFKRFGRFLNTWV